MSPHREGAPESLTETFSFPLFFILNNRLVVVVELSRLSRNVFANSLHCSVLLSSICCFYSSGVTIIVMPRRVVVCTHASWTPNINVDQGIPFEGRRERQRLVANRGLEARCLRALRMVLFEDKFVSEEQLCVSSLTGRIGVPIEANARTEWVRTVLGKIGVVSRSSAVLFCRRKELRGATKL